MVVIIFKLTYLMLGYKCRKEIDYDIKELADIKDDKNILSSEISKKIRDGTNVIYKNQEKCAIQICNAFMDKRVVNVLVYGKTQTGKTGCMTSIINKYVSDFVIPTKNIFVITGHSDKAWKQDTINRMPDSIRKNIFHRSDLSKKFIDKLNQSKNILVIMDEIQIACKDSQTLHKTFKECGFYDLNNVLEKNIKFAQFSATPDGNINDISDWENYSSKFKLEPGENYIGVNELLIQNRIRQFTNLTEIDNVNNLKKPVESFSTPRYHIIRINNTKTNKQYLTISNFKRTFGDTYMYNIEFLNKKKKDINKLLEVEPKQHEFIFICEIIRCAKTLIKKYIGILYERFIVNPNDSSIIQGLSGRLTGYDDNGTSICYTNIETLKKYKKMWDNDMKLGSVPWNTNTTKYNKDDKMTYSNGTFNSIKYIDELKHNEYKIKSIKCKVIIKKFKDQKTMISWCTKNLDPTKVGRINIREPNADGYYTGSLRDGNGILSQYNVNNNKGWGINKKNKKRIFPCYSDVNDKLTLEWWLLYHENTIEVNKIKKE